VTLDIRDLTDNNPNLTQESYQWKESDGIRKNNTGRK
jgi:hypothetical protein